MSNNEDDEIEAQIKVLEIYKSLESVGLDENQIVSIFKVIGDFMDENEIKINEYRRKIQKNTLPEDGC